MGATAGPGRRRPAASRGRGERCPACPFRGLTGAETSCPSCGTDLTALRAVQHLPDALLADGLAFARAGDLVHAAESLAAAAAFDRTRAAATAILRGWRDACPNPACALRGRTGRGNVRLMDRGPMWRCEACGRTFPGTGAGAVVGSWLSSLRRGRLPRLRRPSRRAWKLRHE